MNSKNNKKVKVILEIVFFVILMVLSVYFQNNSDENNEQNNISNVTNIPETIYDISNIPAYNGNIYIEINNNIPKFTEEDINIKEPYYSDLVDNRVGMAMIKTNWEKANEDDEKNDYSSIMPSGYVQRTYDKSIVKGGYLYHRSHIIAWKLGGLDNDPRNLMTGTRDFNEDGMRKFEDEIYNYLKNNKQNNVLYRATPYFEEDNQLANRNKFRSMVY